jgi:hypothetical protein
MTFRLQFLLAVAVIFVPTVFSFSPWARSASAQDKQLTQAMGFKPKHESEVDYEKPGVAVLKDCKIERTTSPAGFVVYHATGRVLRKFVDTNKDEKLDQWSYYKDGLEVYRDVDSNFDERLDQYRWVGASGTRWGVDTNQDGEIDRWKVISPEEIAYECFQAVKQQDQARFNRLLLSDAEFKSLGLNGKIAAAVADRWKTARSKFVAMSRSQKAITPKSKWVYAGNGQPSMMPSGDGNKTDVVVYDHASGFFENGTSTQQIALGSMVKVGDSWRLVELPEIVNPKEPLENGGVFFPREEYGTGSGPSQGDEELAKLLNQLSTVEADLAKAKGVAVERGERAKADVIVKLVQFYSKIKDKTNAMNWQENLADSVSSAYQADRFEGGIDYLNRYLLTNKGAPGLDYLKWRTIFSEYAWVNANGSKKQINAAQEKLNGELKGFQETFANSERFAPRALVQLAVHYEVEANDEPEKAMEWYRECLKRFPQTKWGSRSRGAIVRLGSFGKTFPFVGKTARGQKLDLARLKGKIVVLHYWETWCCDEDDIKELARLQSKYKDELVVVSCNIEGIPNGGDEADATKEFQQFVSRNAGKMTWTQLHEPGSVDSSPLAHQLGIATEPTIILVDKEGKLVETNISLDSLEREIERERRRKK